jgi:hypothetical protein
MWCSTGRGIETASLGELMWGESLRFAAPFFAVRADDLVNYAFWLSTSGWVQGHCDGIASLDRIPVPAGSGPINNAGPFTSPFDVACLAISIDLKKEKYVRIYELETRDRALQCDGLFHVVNPARAVMSQERNCNEGEYE